MRTILLINLLLLIFTPKTKACGYDWIGACSSSVHLRINGTLDSFSVADCPSGIRYQGLHLGTLQNLSLANAKAVTWESCLNHVSAVQLKYRIYEQGGGAGAFQTLNLDQDYFTVLGPYTSRYRSQASDLDLVAGLSIGQNYVLEVYFLAEVDTLGDDFIPETMITQNNNGENYRLSFVYGGSSAAPFVVIPTLHQEPVCHGASNGAIGVSVWGDQTGLFYNWSNLNLNFYQQNDLPAGTYTVTVSGANHTETSTIELGEPDSLSVQAISIQPLICGGGLGSISILASGGTPPYLYLWSNAQTTATATFTSSGNYSLTLTDAHVCSSVHVFKLPGEALVQQNQTRTICLGQSIEIGGVVIQMAGTYNLGIPGLGGCDTLLTLTVLEINSGLLLAGLPASIEISCYNPSINLCAETAPAATYQWAKDGIPATQTPCLLATAGGNFTLMVTQSGCSATHSIVSVEHLVGPLVSASGSLDYIMDCYTVDSSVMHLQASVNQPGCQFEWVLQGQTISTSDTCTLYFDSIPNPFPTIPVVKVKDPYGCMTSKQPTVWVIAPPWTPYIYYDFDANLCTGLTEVEFDVSGIQLPYTVTINDSILDGHTIALFSGQYPVVITDVNACLTTTSIYVPPLFSAYVEDAPFSNWNTGAVYISESIGSWFTYLWDNGEMGSEISGLAPGNYCVTITDMLNNCAVDTCFTVHGAVAAQEPTKTTLSLFPNPVTAGAWLTLDLPEKMMNAEIHLDCIDSQGKTIWSETSQYLQKSPRILVPEYMTSGIFNLRVSSTTAQLLGRFCVKK